MASDDTERTEAPTPKRRHEARERGQVARSTELNSALLLVGTCGALAFGGGLMGHTLLGTFRDGLQLGGGTDLTPEMIRARMVSAAWVVARTIAPVALAGAAVGVLANVLQVGFMVAPKAISLRWERLDPMRGFSRIVSLGGVVEAVKALLKLTILGAVAAWTLRPAWVRLPELAGMDIMASVQWQFDLGFRLAFRVVAVFGLLALADYAYQRWQHERRLRMTRSEIQEEGKQQEGNPQIRARVRSLQRERRLRRMMDDVASASVVVVNPTHLAVAIAYAQRSMRAPRVVAKGKRLLAERIVLLAREAGVPVIQDIPLARSLYKLVEVGGEIPVILYQAVAKVLAYVYNRTPRREAAR